MGLVSIKLALMFIFVLTLARVVFQNSADVWPCSDDISSAR
jgi:hypothetical protein